MKRKLTIRRPRFRGFTLVEILVVLAILVLLVGMVAPRVLKSQKKADISNTKAQIGMFRSCLERYALDMKDFPTTEQGLKALLQAPESEGAPTAEVGAAGESGGTTSNWEGPYVNQEVIPKDPWGNDYQYEYPPTHGKGEYPDIWSFGPDRQDGTDDDIVSWSSSDGESDTTGGEKRQAEAPAPRTKPED